MWCHPCVQKTQHHSSTKTMFLAKMSTVGGSMLQVPVFTCP